MCGSAKRQRTSPEFQFWGPSRQQAGELHTLSGRKPRKYKPGTTQYHPASVCANPFGRRQNARYTRLDRVTRTLGAASWLPLGRVRLDGPGASESPECAPAPDAFGRWGSHTATSAVLMKCVRRYALRPPARTATSPPDCCCPSVAVTDSSTAVRCFNPTVNTTTPNFGVPNDKQSLSSESRLAFKSGHLVDIAQGHCGMSERSTRHHCTIVPRQPGHIYLEECQTRLLAALYRWRDPRAGRAGPPLERAAFSTSRPRQSCIQHSCNLE